MTQSPILTFSRCPGTESIGLASGIGERAAPSCLGGSASALARVAAIAAITALYLALLFFAFAVVVRMWVI